MKTFQRKYKDIPDVENAKYDLWQSDFTDVFWILHAMIWRKVTNVFAEY